jgi:FdrA protein
MTERVVIRHGAYRDSVKLMLVSRELIERGGVVAAVVAMATPLNLELIRRQGFELSGPSLSPDDLVIAIRAEDKEAADAAAEVAQAAVDRVAMDGGEVAAALGSVRHAARVRPGLNLAFIGVPGRYAAIEAAMALDAGLHVFCFSDGVSLHDEVALKERAIAEGLMMMGPDCGTALIGGVALGFANRVERGPVGVVGASGTGIQELTCLLDIAGVGISHAIGVGARDLGEVVAGSMTTKALTLLDSDPLTELIVVVTKPPAPRALDAVRACAERIEKPVVFAVPGADASPDGSEISIDAAAMRVAARFGAEIPSLEIDLRGVRADGCVRGLFCGGTLAAEAMAVLAAGIGMVRSNVPLRSEWLLGDVNQSQGHTIVDFGDDVLTQGRAHPVIDPSLRLERLRAELEDPATAIILLDVILGYGAHTDPAAELAPVIAEGLAARSDIAIGVSVCGTQRDPQGLDTQVAALGASGALITRSAAALGRAALAALTAGEVASEHV